MKRSAQWVLLACLALLCIPQLNAQTIQGTIRDKKTGEPLPFAAIIEQGTVNGVYSDIDGRFELTLTDSNNAIYVSLIGYTPSQFNNYKELPPTILLSEQSSILNEVTIRPGLNPAEIIMQRAIDNRKKNNPEGNIAFTYNSYNKLIVGGDIDSTMLQETNLSTLDSNTTKALSFLNQQYLFLMESITERKYCPTNHSEETILANRVSGLKNTEFALLGTQLQSFSFYGESVELLGVKYMSPLAKNAINKYYFELEDTTYIGKDSVFAISFRPRTKKNFPSMSGRLYINSNGYAIQQVLAEPHQAGKTHIKIQQQYAFLYDKIWFPLQLNSSIAFDSTLTLETFPMIGEGRSYIKNIRLDAPLKANEFTPVALQMLPNAGNANDSLWNKYRVQPLNTKEARTYTFIDSVGREVHLDRRLKALEALTTGEISIGYINFDLKQLLAFNDYEGLRLGGGLRTNHRLSEKFNFGGYLAYGFKDRATKYGGDALIHVYRKRNAWIKLEYKNDVKELGGNGIQVSDQGQFFTQNLYRLFVSRMDRRELMQASFNGRLIGNLTCTAFINSQYIQTFSNYTFKQESLENVTLIDSNFRITETGALFRFAPGERLARTPSREIRLGGRFPVLHFQITTGMNNLLKGEYAYRRYDFRVDKTFNMMNAGKLSISAVAGMCSNNVPLSLLYNAEGTYNRFTIVAPGSFQTMRTNEFVHARYAALHVRHTFRPFEFFNGKFKPQPVIAHSMLWGDFKYENNHSFTSSQAEKGFFESGVQLDNLIVSNISGIGLGVYYRYGTYGLPTFKENIAIKFSSTIVF